MEKKGSLKIRLYDGRRNLTRRVAVCTMIEGNSVKVNIILKIFIFSINVVIIVVIVIVIIDKIYKLE